MKIDIVIPLGNGSKWDDNELRYSLRSIEKHLNNVGRIFVIGEKPEWLCNIIHVPFEETGHASQNIQQKLLKACNDVSVSERFMYWNDDFFLIKDVDAETYPYYHGGDLCDHIKPTGNWYNDYLKETKIALENSENKTLNFDIHCPIIYEKKRFRTSMARYNFNQKLLIKSIYCNENEIPGQLMGDCKIRSRHTMDRFLQAIHGHHLFSTGDGCLLDWRFQENPIKQYLKETFPNKSKYEN